MNIFPGFALIILNFTGPVVSISDGDTIKVLHDGVPEKIRLARIDCPEISHGRKPGQPFGQNAKRFTSDMCFGKVVEVDDKTHDRYGRMVGEVILPDGRDLNVELVRNGLAWWYERYAPDARDLAELQNEAQQKRIGLWADPGAIPPWEFRKAEKNRY